MENFQNYGTNPALLLAGMGWADVDVSGIGDDIDPNADADSKCLSFNTNGTGSSGTRLVIPTATAQLGVAFRLWVSPLPETYSHGSGVSFNTVGNDPTVGVFITPTGGLRLVDMNGTYGTSADVVIDETSGPVISSGAHHHIEFFFDNVTGEYEVRVEGVEVMSGTTVEVTAASFGIVEFRDTYVTSASSSGYTRRLKDLIVWDTSGSLNNNFIGPVTVYTLQVDGDVSATNVTSTGASNYSVVDEMTPNDADYLTMGAIPSSVIMTFEDVPADVVAIRAVQTVVRAQKTDGGDAFMQVGLLSNGDEDTGSDDAVSTSFTYHFDVSETNPDTSTVWTPTTVNAATLKINRTL
jgi:hypothetical protein